MHRGSSLNGISEFEYWTATPSHCLAIMSRQLVTHTFSNAVYLQSQHILEDGSATSGNVSADTGEKGSERGRQALNHTFIKHF